MNIDVERLRRDLIDYYGTAIYTINPVAIMDVYRMQNYTDKQIIEHALKLNIDLEKYIKRRTL